MANRTSWVTGNGNGGAGLTWIAAFNTTDFTASLLTNGQSVMSTVEIDNNTALDQFMDISCQLSISSSTIVQGANFTFWLATCLADGTTYGDGHLTAGTAASITPVWPALGQVPLYAAVTQTALAGSLIGIVIPPGKFKLVIQNNSGFTLTSTTTVVDYRTYNINLND